ncbi:MAG: phosphotransferase [Acidimicrobiales bacterium]
MSAEQLEGGLANTGRVTRVGDVVRRPAPPNAPLLHSLLRHLARRAFRAPRPHALEEDGYELPGFVPGDVPIAPYPSWASTDSALAGVARLLRRFHDSVADFEIPDDAQWNVELADPHGGPVVCHNNVCLENVVFSAGTPIALLDFDFAAPGRPVWDVVHAARYWIPLTDPALAVASGRGQGDPFARLRRFVDAYGLDAEDRRAFPDILLEAEEVAVGFVTGRVSRGESAFIEMWDTAGQERFRRKMAWLERNLRTLREALA